MAILYQELKGIYFYHYCYYLPHLCIDYLRTEQSGVRTPLGQEIFFFSAPVRTGHEVHPASCTTGAGCRSQERLGRGFNHPHPSNDKVKRRVETYPYFRALPSWPVIGHLYPYLYKGYETYTLETILVSRIHNVAAIL